MKAIQYDRYGGPEVLKYRDLPDPVPDPDEALIAVRCASVIPGDWKVRSGQLREMFPLKLPTIPGRDGAGTVIAKGTACDWTSVGDELCFVTEHTEPGSYAGLVSRPRQMTVPKPANTNFAQAAAVVHAGVCAWIGLIETARIEAGERVLIHAGAGAIGGIAVQIAKNVGCEVTATCSATNIDYVRGLGADHVIAYDKENFAEASATQHVVLDLIGGAAHEASCRIMKKKGRLVWLIADPFEDKSTKYNVVCQQAVIHNQPTTLKQVFDAVARGDLVPQVSRSMPLSEAAKAHRLYERGENSRGRIILEIGE